jgi:hypothetical protein
LRAANVLLIGIRGLGSEIAKNILLSGINSLTILDDGVVTESDILHNFLLHEKVPVGSKIAEEVLPRAQSLNPLVKIATDTEPVSAKSADYFKEFTIVVATKIKFEHILKIDNVCRENSVKFIYGDVFGFFGFSVSDLQEHDYFEDRVQLIAGQKRGHDGEKKTVKIKGNMSYPPLNKVLILPNTKQDIIGIKKLSRPNNLFICMLSKCICLHKRFGTDATVQLLFSAFRVQETNRQRARPQSKKRRRRKIKNHRVGHDRSLPVFERKTGQLVRAFVRRVGSGLRDPRRSHRTRSHQSRLTQGSHDQQHFPFRSGNLQREGTECGGLDDFLTLF